MMVLRPAVIVLMRGCSKQAVKGKSFQRKVKLWGCCCYAAVASVISSIVRAKIRQVGGYMLGRCDDIPRLSC